MGSRQLHIHYHYHYHSSSTHINLDSSNLIKKPSAEYLLFVALKTLGKSITPVLSGHWTLKFSHTFSAIFTTFAPKKDGVRNHGKCNVVGKCWADKMMTATNLYTSHEHNFNKNWTCLHWLHTYIPVKHSLCTTYEI